MGVFVKWGWEGVSTRALGEQGMGQGGSEERKEGKGDEMSGNEITTSSLTKH